ncbi:MAG: DUF4153 domain-containing protein [Chitinophagales bacterium]|nr:DUF4153 domain-containing protein [Chitinophagales bacterium]
MKFPSFQEVFEETKRAITRFPLAAICAVIGTILVIELVNLEPEEEALTPWMKAIGTCVMGLPLFFATHIYIEKNNIVGKKKGLFILGAILTLLAAYLTFEWSNKFKTVISLFRYFLWLIGAHLLVAISAFQRKEEINGFWQYNKLLFLRFVNSAFFAMVLFAGLAGAILSVQALFDVKFDDKIFFYLFATLAGIFNTFYFFAGIPEDINTLQSKTEYPKGLRIFAQFILIPLVIIYLVILYMYGGKIILQGHLPIGWVSNLILVFSVFGILALLLIYPLRNDENHLWIKTYFRAYFIALLPLIALLFVSIITRIKAYGFTEWRYIGFVLAIWLLSLSLYFILSKRKNIFYIPFSLLLLCLLSTTGYWSMFHVSTYNQTNRFTAILEKNDIIKDGKIDCNAKKKHLKDTEVQSLESIIDYMDEHQEKHFLLGYFEKKCEPVKEADYFAALYDKIPIEWSNPRIQEQQHDIYTIDYAKPLSYDIEGYTRIFPEMNLHADSDVVEEDNHSTYFSLGNNKFSYMVNGEYKFSYDLTAYVASVMKERKPSYNRFTLGEPKQITLQTKEGHNYKIIFKYIEVEEFSSSLTINTFSCLVLEKE